MKTNGSPTRQQHSEEIVVGTLIDDFPEKLEAYPHLSKLVNDAPESFDDRRFGLIVSAIRGCDAAAENVNIVSISRRVKEVDLESILLLSRGGLPIDAAESEAEILCAAYEIRRTKSIFTDALASLESAPDKAATIADVARRALEPDVPEVKSRTLTLRSPDEILAMQFDDSDIILGDRLIAKGQSAVIIAQGGLGKSRMILQLAASVISGRDFLNFKTNGQDLRWLILQTENSNRRLKDDLQRIKSWLGDDWPRFQHQVVFHTIENDDDCFVSLDSPENQMAIQDAIEAAQPDIISPDPLNDFAIGDLNKDSDMRATLIALSRICRRGNPKRAIIVLHHALTGKAGASKATGFDRASFGRNSKTLHAWTRGQINLAPVDADNNERLILASGKCSNGREFAPFGVRLNPGTMIYEVDPTIDVSAWAQEMAGSKDAAPLMNPDRVRELCGVSGSDKATLAKAITDDCGCYRGSAYRYIARAEQAKKISFSKSNENYFRK